MTTPTATETMVYIIILNWNGATDTIACLKTVLALTNANFQVVICDNASADNSYDTIKEWLIEHKLKNPKLAQRNIIELTRSESESFISENNAMNIFLIQTGDNLGYAGGNNVGIRLALNQPKMSHVWILNNDTEVDPESLQCLLERCKIDPEIGICGSKLVYHHDRKKIQGLGGIYNPWLCTAKHYAAFEDSNKEFDDHATEASIDYIIGASMLISRPLLEDIGLLNEEYFLYYEELDIVFRARNKYKVGSASKSIVYHKEGGSIQSTRGATTDFYFIRNRLVFTKRHNKKFLITVWLSLLLVIINRLKRLEFKKAKNALSIFLGKREINKTSIQLK